MWLLTCPCLYGLSLDYSDWGMPRCSQKGNPYLQPGGTSFKWPVWIDGNHFYLCPLRRTPPGKHTLYISPIRNEKSDFWKLDGEILIRVHAKLRRGLFSPTWGSISTRPLGTVVTCSADLLHLRHRSNWAFWMTHGYLHPLPTGHLSLSGLGRLVFSHRGHDCPTNQGT